MQVEKFGDPNGIIEFAGAATSMRELEEPAGTQLQELGFPVVRQAGTGITGVLKVRCFPFPFGSSRCCAFPFPVDPQGTIFPFSCGSSRYSFSLFLWVLKVQCFPLSFLAICQSSIGIRGVLRVEHLLLRHLTLVCWYGTGGKPTTATNASLALV